MSNSGDEMKLIERVNNAANASLESFLYDLLPGGKIEGHYFVAKNPTRGDSEPGSFKINLENCKWKDFATSDPGGNDPVSLYRYITGKSKMGEAARELADKLGVSGKAKNPKPTDTPIKRKRPGQWQPIQPIPETTEPPPEGMVSSPCWVYKDKAGQLLGYIMRRDKGGGKKDFFPLTYCTNFETGEMAWRFQGFKAPRPLYGLDLLAKFPDRGVVIVEGEKTAEAARKILNGDAVVVTWPGGAQAINEVDWSELAGRRVAIWPDNDKPGREAAIKIALKIVDTAEVVKLVEPPVDTPEGWDLADAGQEWTRERLREFIRDEAKIYNRPTEVKRPPASMAEEIFEAVNSSYTYGAEELSVAQDSIVADQIARHLRAHFIFDTSRTSWFQFNDIWQETSEGSVKSEVMGVMRWFFPKGLTSSKFNSIFAFMKLNLLRSPFESSKHRGAIVDTWNQDKDLVPFRNGVLNIKTRELLPHAPALMFCWRLPYDFDALATCPVILELIHNIADGQPATIKVLTSFLAAVLSGRADLQKYLELIGKPGSGKSTFIKIAENLVGKENTVSTTMRQLTENRFETAEFYGKRLAIISDADQWAGSVEVFKAIVGQDPLRFERKHVQQGRPFIFGGLIIVAANGPISTNDHSTAMARRRVPVHVDKVFPVEKIVSNLDEKIRAQMPGLINILLEVTQPDLEDALRDLQGLRVGDAMRSLVETHPLADWANQCLVFDEGTHSRIGEKRHDGGGLAMFETWLYPNYLTFMERNGHKGGIAQRAFSRSLVEILERAGIKTDKKRSKEGYTLSNVRIRQSGMAQPLSFRDKSQPLLLTKETIEDLDES